MMKHALAGLLMLVVATPALAQAPQSTTAQTPATQDPQTPGELPTFEERMVVSASRVEQQLVNAPAAVSVVTSETIQNSPAFNIGDLLRAVPGVNVTQGSARDINITSRGATSTLSTSQLALVDGRSIYLDFFGMVMWDMVPTNPNDIKQIEVIRGPASAVWGANAMTGVVNVITKSPRELAAEGGGNSITFGLGGFDRTTPARSQNAGALFSVNGAHAQAVNDRWSYKVSAGYFTLDPLPRPTGTLPNKSKTPYPDYVNSGTSQPKFDARVDYDMTNGARVTVAGGVAGTEGIIHSGIGPFDISSGSRLTYLTTRYQKAARRIAFFTNLLNGDAVNLLSRTTTGAFLPLGFDTKTMDVEVSDTRIIGTTQAVSYGGNFRHNTFDITLAPNGDARNEGGAYVQDEIFLNNRFRWVVGGRVDKFSSISSAVFSPRTTFIYKPASDQALRVSFNRAFRSPSFVNNNIDTRIVNQVNLGLINPALSVLPPYNFPITAIGNPDLKQETMTAFEVGYSGEIHRRAAVSAAVYWNHTADGIFFTQTGVYRSSNPPPGWGTAVAPLPPAVLDLLAAAGSGLPSTFSYRNLGSVNDKGIELGVDATANRFVNLFANYSYQATPVVKGFDPAEANRPSHNRFNTGANFSYQRYLGNLSVNYTGDAYWQDVLDAPRFGGNTKAYTLVNLGLGVRFAKEKVVTSLKVTNLANQAVMQHVFGDVLKRTILGEVRFTF